MEVVRKDCSLEDIAVVVVAPDTVAAAGEDTGRGIGLGSPAFAASLVVALRSLASREIAPVVGQFAAVPAVVVYPVAEIEVVPAVAAVASPVAAAADLATGVAAFAIQVEAPAAVAEEVAAEQAAEV